MGKGNRGFKPQGIPNPMLMSRARQVSSGPTIQERLNRSSRPTWDDLKKLAHKKERTSADFLDEWENENYRVELQKFREAKRSAQETKQLKSLRQATVVRDTTISATARDLGHQRKQSPNGVAAGTETNSNDALERDTKFVSSGTGKKANIEGQSKEPRERKKRRQMSAVSSSSDNSSSDNSSSDNSSSDNSSSDNSSSDSSSDRSGDSEGGEERGVKFGSSNGRGRKGIGRNCSDGSNPESFEGTKSRRRSGGSKGEGSKRKHSGAILKRKHKQLPPHNPYKLSAFFEKAATASGR